MWLAGGGVCHRGTRTTQGTTAAQRTAVSPRIRPDQAHRQYCTSLHGKSQDQIDDEGDAPVVAYRGRIENVHRDHDACVEGSRTESDV